MSTQLKSLCLNAAATFGIVWAVVAAAPQLLFG